YHYLGSTEKVHNIYNLLWAKTIFDGFKQLRPGERIFNLTRSGYAGIQRYGVIPWSGDVGRSFGGLAVQLPMLLNMGISGLGYQNSDIGGFTGNGTTELYVRWMQFGVFSPITRAHGTGQPTEPWAFGTEAEGINKKFIELRYRMIPYNYTLAYENFKTGIPLARPLFFEYPEDNNLYSLSSSYLWGSSILVAPVVEAGQSSKSVYLPDGDWIDFWSDKIYSGHKNITVATPLDKIPLFIRRGSIIPMQPLMNYSDEHTLDTLFLSIYPSHSREAYYRLYEDDGKTLQYQSGRYAETIFTQYISSTATGEELVLNIGATQGDYNGKLLNRTYIADIHLVSGHPQAIKKNSLPLQFRNSLDEMRQTEEGCYYDSLNSRLYIQIKTIPDSSYKIVVSDLDLLSSASEGKSTLARYQLAQNYPNPFNPVTTIRYGVAERSHVRLKIYDALGREIRILVDQDELPGNHQVEFDARDLPSGIYIYEIQAGSYRESKKMNFIK
ncbi:MAG: TIM-barrel domain-containing protein, partial [Ignavibacteriales bacterium]